ncbi:MAG TPA: RNA 2',3'-cyclic phosphodiesterase [Verrucomicrobiae bacterium]|nr:RNA 2',3'-cyclic phosphodiesterase [Verrucomicrobiae bacterium]
MRLFTALDLPAEVVGNLEELLRRLRPTARINWSPPANLHITTKFIGEWPEERLGELKSVLGTLPPRRTIPVHVHDVGFFPNERSPRVFWCGIEAPGLAELARELDAVCGKMGIAREPRPFSPHLTLARIKERLNLDALHGAIASLPKTGFGTFEAPSFFLYRSQLNPKGSVYTKLAEFALSRE